MFKEIKENTSKILNGLQEDINKQLNKNKDNTEYEISVQQRL